MTIYRRKQVVVEARRLTRENGRELWEWANSKPWYGSDGRVHGLSIYTPHGRIKADFGDFIIKDPDGSFRPIKPDIFEAAYEPVATAEPAHQLPQLAVACPTCQAEPGDLCTSHSGTRVRRTNTHIARMRAWLDATSIGENSDAPRYPNPGSEIPGQPGYVVGTCRHRVAGSEWRAGFRTCERCPREASA
jgi:hypothetical protein